MLRQRQADEPRVFTRPTDQQLYQLLLYHTRLQKPSLEKTICNAHETIRSAQARMYRTHSPKPGSLSCLFVVHTGMCPLPDSVAKFSVDSSTAGNLKSHLASSSQLLPLWTSYHILGPPSLQHCRSQVVNSMCLKINQVVPDSCSCLRTPITKQREG